MEYFSYRVPLNNLYPFCGIVPCICKKHIETDRRKTRHGRPMVILRSGFIDTSGTKVRRDKLWNLEQYVLVKPARIK
jgi:hypothetical protein